MLLRNDGSLARESSLGRSEYGRDRSGQGELKRCTAPGSGGGPQAAAVRLDDGTADGQPHTSPGIFGGKELWSAAVLVILSLEGQPLSGPTNQGPRFY